LGLHIVLNGSRQLARVVVRLFPIFWIRVRKRMTRVCKLSTV
jgi:hypothetical protein